MNIRSRFISLVTLLSAVIAMGGLSDCSSNNAEENAVNRVTINGEEPARGLIPAAADDDAGIKVIDLLFAGLVTYDEQGKVVNDVAREITDSPDHKTWTIQMNTDRKFSNGTPVLAKNYVRAWKASAAQKLGATTAFEAIEGAEEDGTGNLSGVMANDDYKITIKLKRAVADFSNRLGINGFYPLPDSAFDDQGKIKKEFGQKPVGNGPYTLAKWESSSRILLDKSTSYRGPRQAVNDGLELKIYADISAAYQDLLSGNLDVLDQIPDGELPNVKKDLGNRTTNAVQAGMQTLDIDYQTKHFSGEEGKLRRQAISQAINREQIIKSIFYGTRKAASDFLPPQILGHIDSGEATKVLQYNEAAAKKAWEAADAISPWQGELKITYNSNQSNQPWVDAVCNQLSNALGIKAVGDPQPDFKTLLEMMDQHSFTGPFRMGWSMGYPSPNNLLAGRYVKGGNGNKMGYDNPAYAELLTRAQAADTAKEAGKLYQQAQTLLLADLPSIPLWSPSSNIGFSQNVGNVTSDWKGAVAFHKVIKN